MAQPQVQRQLLYQCCLFDWKSLSTPQKKFSVFNQQCEHCDSKFIENFGEIFSYLSDSEKGEMWCIAIVREKITILKLFICYGFDHINYRCDNGRNSFRLLIDFFHHKWLSNTAFEEIFTLFTDSRISPYDIDDEENSLFSLLRRDYKETIEEAICKCFPTEFQEMGIEP